MKISFSCLSIFLVTLSAVQNSYSQTAYLPTGKPAVDQFYTSIGNNALLFNGTEYSIVDPSIKGHPYFLTNQFEVTSLTYSDVSYNSIPLLYDMWNETVVARRPDGIWMSLIPDKIKYFMLGNHNFIRISGDSSAHEGISAGFYDRLYEGPSQVIVKRHKRLFESNSFEKRFIESTKYFVRKNGKYYSVSSKRTLLNLFRDRKDVIRKYLRSQKLNFKKETEKTLSRVAAFYDQFK